MVKFFKFAKKHLPSVVALSIISIALVVLFAQQLLNHGYALINELNGRAFLPEEPKMLVANWPSLQILQTEANNSSLSSQIPKAYAIISNMPYTLANLKNEQNKLNALNLNYFFMKPDENFSGYYIVIGLFESAEDAQNQLKLCQQKLSIPMHMTVYSSTLEQQELFTLEESRV